MKQLVKHLWQHHAVALTGKSFLHCHVRNVHSIMLMDNPEWVVRLYIADTGNELFYNYKDNYKMKKMTTAFHPHHSDLTLYCIKGMFMNWLVKESAEGFSANKYLYHSQITEGQAKFEPLGETKLETVKNELVTEGESIILKASDIHTIGCAPDKVTAWFVFEGKEDKDYKPYCWSNDNLTGEKLHGFYQKPSQYDVEKLLTLVGLL